MDLVSNFRRPAEHAAYRGGGRRRRRHDLRNFPYGGAPELTDELIDTARAALKDADEKGDTAALHCRTGNRVGPGWAPYRAIDRSIAVEQAIGEAKAMQMVDPLAESRTRDYIRRRAASGAASGADGGWKPIAIETLTPLQQAQRERAVQARDAMFAHLLAALGEAMRRPGPEGGAAGAIAVCKEHAPTIAQAVAREKGVMIGRTSAKLRNPANVAPEWAGPLLSHRPSEPRLAANTNGSLGVTLPIRLAADCLALKQLIER